MLFRTRVQVSTDNPEVEVSNPAKRESDPRLVNFLEAEKDRMDAKAKRLGMSRSAMLRQAWRLLPDPDPAADRLAAEAS